MYNVNLEVFQGPLDLLLHLIEKMEIDIHNIPIAKLTDSYLEYISNVDEISLENAEEYIVMASTLIHIKSKSLLPVDTDEESYYEEEDLVQQLLDYRVYKELYDVFQEMQISRDNFGEKQSEDLLIDAKLMNMSVEKLHKAFKRVMSNFEFIEAQAEKLQYKKEVSIENIRKKIDSYLEKKNRVSFLDIVSNYDTKSEVVVTFICILDMIKEQVIVCNEINDELFIEKIEQ